MMEPIDEQLAALPEIDVDEWRRERIRKRAHEELARQRDPQWLRSLERLYARVLEPALIVSVTPIYIAWAISRLTLLQS